MKKIILSMSVAAFLTACNANPGESGAVDDGIKTVDSNGALPDAPGYQPDPSTDTARGEHRVDTEQRDSSGLRQ